MAQETAPIRFVKDKNDNVFYPITHEKAIRDNDGVVLETKLASMIRSSDANNIEIMEQEAFDAMQDLSTDTIYMTYEEE